LDAVTDDIILIALDVERIHRLERFETALRHREGVVAEVDFLLHLIIFEHREIDDPAEAEDVLFADIKLIPDTDARLAGRLGGPHRFVAGKEVRIPLTQARNLANFCKPLLVEMFRNRPAGFTILEDDIAKTARAFFAGPVIHLVKEA